MERQITPAEIHAEFRSCMKELSISDERLDKLKKCGIKHITAKYEDYSEALIKYPGYKIIYTEDIEKICQKYNLIFSPIDRFKGNIPSKNLNELSNFIDRFGRNEYMIQYKNWWGITKIDWIFGHDKAKRLAARRKDGKIIKGLNHLQINIACPYTDLLIRKGDIIKDNILIEDPVVFIKPKSNSDSRCFTEFDGNSLVNYETRYWIIVTAWGDEAKDEIIFNERQN